MEATVISKNSQKHIVPGSIGAIAKQEGKSLAESFVGADVVVVMDCSGSMSAEDSRGGKSRYQVAFEELTVLQSTLPGRIALISFNNDVKYCPHGVPLFAYGSTDLANALRFAKVADLTGMKFFLISDGEPDNERTALEIAKQYKNKINVIYVGPEDHPYGRDFLTKLANATGGVAVTADRAKELKNSVVKLLSTGT